MTFLIKLEISCNFTTGQWRSDGGVKRGQLPPGARGRGRQNRALSSAVPAKGTKNDICPGRQKPWRRHCHWVSVSSKASDRQYRQARCIQSTVKQIKSRYFSDNRTNKSSLFTWIVIEISRYRTNNTAGL
jgi:hypothetical protein